jgi:hypothetical protein
MNSSMFFTTITITVATTLQQQLQQHCNNIATTLQQHCNNIATALQQHCKNIATGITQQAISKGV